MRNDEFEVTDVFIQCQVILSTSLKQTLSTNPPIHIYINRINSGLVFKIKGEWL